MSVSNVQYHYLPRSNLLQKTGPTSPSYPRFLLGTKESDVPKKVRLGDQRELKANESVIKNTQIYVFVIDVISER